jgi:hypothetical protein
MEENPIIMVPATHSNANLRTKALRFINFISRSLYRNRQIIPLFRAAILRNQRLAPVVAGWAPSGQTVAKESKEMRLEAFRG